MRKIKILGIGSAKYKQLTDNVLTAIKELNIEAEVEQLQEVEDFIRYNIVEIPSIIIDGKIQSVRKVPEVQELKKLLLNTKQDKVTA